MDGRTRVRLGIGLAGLLTFAGSFALISSSDETDRPAGETPDLFQTPFPEPELDEQYLLPELEEEEEAFSPQFMRQQEGWVPQTRTRAS